MQKHKNFVKLSARNCSFTITVNQSYIASEEETEAEGVSLFDSLYCKLYDELECDLTRKLKHSSSEDFEDKFEDLDEEENDDNII